MCGRNFIYFTGFTLIVFMVVPVTEESEEGEKIVMGTHDKVIISVLLTRYFFRVTEVRSEKGGKERDLRRAEKHVNLLISLFSLCH